MKKFLFIDHIKYIVSFVLVFCLSSNIYSAKSEDFTDILSVNVNLSKFENNIEPTKQAKPKSLNLSTNFIDVIKEEIKKLERASKYKIIRIDTNKSKKIASNLYNILNRIVKKLSCKAGIKKPQIYLETKHKSLYNAKAKTTTVKNSLTQEIITKKHKLVLGAELIIICLALAPETLEAIISHEIGHMADNHDDYKVEQYYQNNKSIESIEAEKRADSFAVYLLGKNAEELINGINLVTLADNIYTIFTGSLRRNFNITEEETKDLVFKISTTIRSDLLKKLAKQSSTHEAFSYIILEAIKETLKEEKNNLNSRNNKDLYLDYLSNNICEQITNACENSAKFLNLSQRNFKKLTAFFEQEHFKNKKYLHSQTHPDPKSRIDYIQACIA